MDDDEILTLLLAAGVLNERESVIRQRLLYQEKVDILATVQQHGAGAITTLTKGDQVIYDRDTETIAGPDEDFLDWAIFRSPPGSGAEDLRYDGPETIQLLAMDHSYPGRAVIGSYSPFKDMAAYETNGECRDESFLRAQEFFAVMAVATPLSVLEQHGRITTEFIDPPHVPGRHDGRQGTWLPRQMPNFEEVRLRCMGRSSMPWPRNGGDFLRFLLLIKRIMASKLSDTDKKNLVHRAMTFIGEDGHSFDRFGEGGADTLLRQLHRLPS
ncbi:hypothetical protein N5C93_17160 [Pseudomonas nitroreducens]|uniref:hypothetical protein n=1 Tax=Pseudomonas nitroreducens TaxID=46680 RepID=UPI00244CD824|nr:hypothetical protein [Pseudomonas nitroreducens]MDH1074573.1 hypothetical protein [Pseudomonas nitroreducens]